MRFERCRAGSGPAVRRGRCRRLRTAAAARRPIPPPPYFAVLGILRIRYSPRALRCVRHSSSRAFTLPWPLPGSLGRLKPRGTTRGNALSSPLQSTNCGRREHHDERSSLPEDPRHAAHPRRRLRPGRRARRRLHHQLRRGRSRRQHRLPAAGAPRSGRLDRAEDSDRDGVARRVRKRIQRGATPGGAPPATHGNRRGRTRNRSSRISSSLRMASSGSRSCERPATAGRSLIPRVSCSAAFPLPPAGKTAFRRSVPTTCSRSAGTASTSTTSTSGASNGGAEGTAH